MFASNSGQFPWQKPKPTPASDDTSTSEINLIDLENENGDSNIGISSTSKSSGHLIAEGRPASRNTAPSTENVPATLNNQKPFKAIANMFQTASQNIQDAISKESEAAKVVNNTGRFISQKGAEVQKHVSGKFKGAATEIQQGTSKTMNQVSEQFVVAGQKFADLDPGKIIPANIRHDVKDMADKAFGSEYLCTKCSELPVSACWEDEADLKYDTLMWKTSLARVISHAGGCRLCKLLLEMLCRPENDPLKHFEVEPYLQPEIKDMSMEQFVNSGERFINTYWPFGRGEEPQEGATRSGAPVKRALKVLEAPTPIERIAITTIKRVIVEASGNPRVKPRVPAKPSKLTYKKGLERGRQEGRLEGVRYPQSCEISISLFTNKSVDFPGLLMVSCVGYGNRPGGEPHALSRFRMRVAHPKIRSNLGFEAPLSYGALLHPNWIDLSVARGWIYECETKHGPLCSQHGWDIALQKLDSIRLIDVQEMRLVERLMEHNTCRYAALSYRWSKTNVTLNYGNRIDFMKKGGLQSVLHQIPKTIVDAMEVVMQLGERYLWVDALCIIQEADDDEAKYHISMMDRVYSGALFTIVAAPDQTGPDGGDIGLQGVRRHHFITRSNINNNSEGTRREISQPSAEIKDGAHVIAPFPCEQKLSTTPWNSRGWTFQERLLSRRLLVFSGNEVVWHCRSMIAREDMRNEDSGALIHPLDWLNLKPKYFNRSIQNHWIDGSLQKDRHGRTHLVRSSTFAEYAKMIKEYTHRQLSFQYDVIRALEGLLHIFAQSFQSDFIYGLPKHLLDIAILWKPIYRLQRRVAENNAYFPSWSWAGWVGPVHYSDSIDAQRDGDGEVVGYRRTQRAGEGEEETRPLLKWYFWDEKREEVMPLNGHGRGIPLDGSDLPSGWEGHNRSDFQIKKDLPSLTNLSLKSHHLIFRTSCVNSFQLSVDNTDLYIQNRNTSSQRLIASPESGHEQTGNQPRRLAILDRWHRNVGIVTLDGEEPRQLNRERYEFLLIGEAQVLDSETSIGMEGDGNLRGGREFQWYTVMLVKRQAESGIYLRYGIGRVKKDMWRESESEDKVVVLG